MSKLTATIDFVPQTFEVYSTIVGAAFKELEENPTQLVELGIKPYQLKRAMTFMREVRHKSTKAIVNANE
jgi:hypothetical protein